jgi:hypothetical protein
MKYVVLTLALMSSLAADLIAFPVNAQQQQQQPQPQQQKQQRFRELDRKYEEAVYLCKRIWGEPMSKERWRAVDDGFNVTQCIQKQLGL